MSLIDTSYFVKDISIPDGGNSNLDNDITKYEPEILKRLLGYELWDLIKDDPTTPDRLNDLINGVEYTVSYNGRDQKVKWNGLKNEDKISLSAYYTYFMWFKNNATSTSNIGEVRGDSENSIGVSAAQKMGSAWHRMRELYGYPGQHQLEPSAYNFLLEHKDDYEEWVYSKIGTVNMFGL